MSKPQRGPEGTNDDLCIGVLFAPRIIPRKQRRERLLERHAKRRHVRGRALVPDPRPQQEKCPRSWPPKDSTPRCEKRCHSLALCAARRRPRQPNMSWGFWLRKRRNAAVVSDSHRRRRCSTSRHAHHVVHRRSQRMKATTASNTASTKRALATDSRRNRRTPLRQGRTIRRSESLVALNADMMSSRHATANADDDT